MTTIRNLSHLIALSIWILAQSSAFAADSQPVKHDRGYAYIHDDIPKVPWSIHIFKVELRHPDLEIHTTLGGGNTFGMGLVSAQVKTLPPDLGQPLAAINGDFYGRGRNYKGHPRETQIRQGELVSGPSEYVCFWIDTTGNPHMTNVVDRFRAVWPNGTGIPFGLNEERTSGAAVLFTPTVGMSTRTSGGMELVLESTTNSLWLPLRAGKLYQARVREVRNSGNSPVGRKTMVLSLGPKLVSRLPSTQPGTILTLSTETIPNLEGVQTVIGGGPTLVRNGQAREWSGIQLRHPRSALGFNKDFLYLVEVDGRQSSLSVGMNLPELAAYMEKLGCDQAMNLDGGGSSTLWVFGQVMNSPSEGHERVSANALVVVKKKTATAPAKP